MLYENIEKLQDLYDSNIIRPGLMRIIELLKRLGNPQNELKCIHVTGTNGKGSTCAYIESVLRYSKYKTASFSSPHIYDIREYIKINNKMISEDDFDIYSKKILDISKEMVSNGFKHPTFFEVMVAIAFEYFSDHDIDIAIIETGMGGTKDATNVIYPILSVITRIGLDHTAYLGDTIGKIAKEKAGIIKDSVPVVIAANQIKAAKFQIKSKCTRVKAKLYSAGNYKTDIYEYDLSGMSFQVIADDDIYRLKIKSLGRHQVNNALNAICAVNRLKKMGYEIDYKALKIGLSSIKLNSRIELIKEENIIIDSSHNPQGVRELGNVINELLPEKKIVLICSVLRTKDVKSMVNEYKKFVDYAIIVESQHQLAMEAENISVEFNKQNIDNEISLSVKEAMLSAGKNSKEKNMFIVVSGTFTIIKDIKHSIIDDIY